MPKTSSTPADKLAPSNSGAPYGIGDLAREFSVTARTIRFYEHEGLIKPARNGQARVYCERDRVRLKLILRGKRIGFSLSEIAEMLDLYDAPEGEGGQIQYVLAKIRERRSALEQQQTDIEEMLAQLEVVEDRLHTAFQHEKGL